MMMSIGATPRKRMEDVDVPSDVLLNDSTASATGAAAQYETRPVSVVGSNPPEDGMSASAVKPIIRLFFETLERRKIRYCHWKSNIRLDETLRGDEDIDVLVDPRDAASFREAMLECGFKLAQSRSGSGHPGVYHALALDEDSAELVHLHAYHQIVSGDSLVKNYRFPIERRFLDETRLLDGIRVPKAEAELILFSLRIALKHVSPIEILLVNRHYRKVAAELSWLRDAADEKAAEALCASWFPSIEPLLFRRLLDSLANEGALARRIVLGWQVAWRLRGLRRLNPAASIASRYWRLLTAVAGRFFKRQDLVLQTGGAIVTLVGPKATGKSTLAHELATRLGVHLNVSRIHAGKPPATVVSVAPRLCVPVARTLLAGERLGEYERPERRQEKRYSLVHVLRMTLLAYDRKQLLKKALRSATAGAIVISDRYPSEDVGAIDSSCFSEEAEAATRSPLKRWLMRRERLLYQGLPRPNIVIRLIAPMNTAIQRDSRRMKEGGPDAEAVQRRWVMENQAAFRGSTTVLINTDAPLDETARAVVRAVWSEL